MKTFAAACRFLALLSAFMALPGCPQPQPGKPGLIDCTVKGVKDNGLPLIPKVNDCLAGMSWESCLVGLIQPLVGITEDVVACVVQNQARSFGEMAAANPNDGVSNLAAQRAQQFIKDKGYQFATPGAGPGQ